MQELDDHEPAKTHYGLCSCPTCRTRTPQSASTRPRLPAQRSRPGCRGDAV